MRRVRHRDRGFTLLEVLVALVIASGALIALSQGAGASLSLSRGANRLDQAVTRARSHLAVAEHGPLFSSETGGDDGGGFRWRTFVRPAETITATRLASATPAGRPLPRLTLFTITATISWSEGGADKAVSVATQAFGPAQDSGS
jgi:general secretion pathway protein I